MHSTRLREEIEPRYGCRAILFPHSLSVIVLALLLNFYIDNYDFNLHVRKALYCQTAPLGHHDCCISRCCHRPIFCSTMVSRNDRCVYRVIMIIKCLNSRWKCFTDYIGDLSVPSFEQRFPLYFSSNLRVIPDKEQLMRPMSLG